MWPFKNKDIDILYKRTDKRLREFEAERKIRVLLQKRVSKLEHTVRDLQSARKLQGATLRRVWEFIHLAPFKLEEKNENNS